MSKASKLIDGLTGAIFEYAGNTAPPWGAFCYGQALSRTTHARLYAVIGTTYGAGDGSTTFNVPDRRGRAAAGKDNMGGTAANRLTTAGSGVDGATLGAVGGAQNHTLGAGEIPAHNHPLGVGGPQTGGGGSINYWQGTGPASGSSTMNNTGGGGAHNNTQPTIVMNFVIVT